MLRKAREELRSTKNWEQYLTNCLYRPFDQRACFFSKVAVDRPRRELQYHVFRRENLCLLAPRRISGLPWQHTFCCVQPASAVSLQVKEGSYVFPIYLYPQRQEGKLLEDDRGEKRRPNISEAFLDDVALKLGLRYVTEHAKGDGRTTFGPEEVLAYIYAVLHAPSYRKRYAEFLKSDFPRIPLTSNAELFCKLCSLGRELVGLHLMEKRGPELASFPVGYDATVERVRYAEPTGQVPGRVWINSRQFFEGLSPDVWAFHVGGYQVCEKWLKDRKGRALSWDDVRHYQGIVGALSETIRLMAEVDATIEAHGGWPLQSASFASAA